MISVILLTTSLNGYAISKFDENYYLVPSADLKLLAETADQKIYWEAEATKARTERDQAQNTQWIYAGAGFLLGVIIAK